MALEFTAAGVFFLASGLAILAMAGWLVYLNVYSRANRAFSLFLALFAATTILAGLAEAANRARDGGLTQALGRVGAIATLLLPFAVGHFMATFPRARTWFGTSRAGPWAIGAAAAVAVAAYLVRPELVISPAPLWYVSVRSFLPLFLIAALVFAVDSRSETDPRRRGSLLAVSAGFAILGTWWHGADGPVHLMVAFGALPRGPFDAIAGAAPALVALAAARAAMVVLVFAALLVVVGQHVRRGERLRNPASLYLGVCGVALGSAAILWVLVFNEVSGREAWDESWGATWRLSLPVVVTFALVRLQLFDISVRFRWTLSKGTLAGFYLVTFLVVSKIGESFAQEVLGQGSWIIGGLAAGVLLFAITPLARFADRLALAATPAATAFTSLTSEDRRSLFRDQARIAWASGALSREGRTMLESLRTSLALSPEEAHELEIAPEPRPAGGLPTVARRKARPARPRRDP